MEEKIISSAAQVIIAITPIVGIAIGGVVVFFSLLWHHLEVRRQILSGTYKREKFNLKAYSLLIGLLLTGSGFCFARRNFYISAWRFDSFFDWNLRNNFL